MNGAELTTEADVWAYAVLVWELFSCGTTPYDGGSGAALSSSMH